MRYAIMFFTLILNLSAKITALFFKLMQNFNIAIYRPYFQGVFLGIITFSIPFLWNAYQRILEKKASITGDKIENILSKEFYTKSIKYFTGFIQLPSGIIVFLGLLVFPLWPHYVGIPLLSVSFVYFLFLPQIFQKIESASAVSLKDFLKKADPCSDDVKKAFREIWEKTDESVEKDFSIAVIHVFDYFSRKVDDLIFDSKNFDNVSQLITDFESSICNRSTLLLIFRREVFPKFLGWHMEIWSKKNQYSIKGQMKKWHECDVTLRALTTIIREVSKRAYDDVAFTIFIKKFREHIGKHLDKVILKNDEEIYYVDSLLAYFYQDFFNIMQSKDFLTSYSLWEVFPAEWKISTKKVKTTIARSTLNNFYRWARPRIVTPEKEYDSMLETVVMNIFPDVEPITFCIILYYVFSYGVRGQEIKTIVESKRNFGLCGRPYARFIKDETEFKKDFEDYTSQQTDNALKLALTLFPAQFSQTNLTKLLDELNRLKTEYESNPENENKRKQFVGIFERMDQILKTKGKPQDVSES